MRRKKLYRKVKCQNFINPWLVHLKIKKHVKFTFQLIVLFDVFLSYSAYRKDLDVIFRAKSKKKPLHKIEALMKICKAEENIQNLPGYKPVCSKCDPYQPDLGCEVGFFLT